MGGGGLGRPVAIGSISSIPIQLRLSPAWLLILALMTVSSSPYFRGGWLAFVSLYPALGPAAQWCLAGLAAPTLYLSAFVHELAHSLVATHQEVKVKSIVISILGGASFFTGEPEARSDLLIAAAGPAANLLIASAMAAVGWLAALASPPLGAYAQCLALANLAVGAFNLLPVFPLDGGRLVRAAQAGARRQLAMLSESGRGSSC